MITESYNFTRFDRALAGYVADLQIEGGKVVKVQAALFVKLLLRFVPPKSLAQGRRAVASDLRKIFRPLDTSEWFGFFDENDRMRILKIDHTTNRRGARVTDEAFFLQRGEMAAFHHHAIDSRGRVRAVNPVNLIGRKKSDVARFGLVKRRDFNGYVKEAQRDVGRAKDSLEPAASRLGITLPGWVTRHGGRGGSVTDQLSDRVNPRITIGAASEGLNVVEPRSVQQAIDTRSRAMESDLRRIMKGGASKYFS